MATGVFCRSVCFKASSPFQKEKSHPYETQHNTQELHPERTRALHGGIAGSPVGSGGFAGSRLRRVYRFPHAGHLVFLDDRDGRAAGAGRVQPHGAGAAGPHRRGVSPGAGAGGAVLFRQYADHQRCGPAHLCALHLCGAGPFGANALPCAGRARGVYANRCRQPWQYAHPHWQPAEFVSLRQKQYAPGAVYSLNAALFAAFAGAFAGVGLWGVPHAFPWRCAPHPQHRAHPHRKPAPCGNVCCAVLRVPWHRGAPCTLRRFLCRRAAVHIFGRPQGPAPGGLFAALHLCRLFYFHWQSGACACLFGMAAGHDRRA